MYMAANKALGFGISIFPMHKGVRKRVTAKRRPLRFTCGHTSTLAMISRAPDATESATEEAEGDIGAVTVEADFQEMMNAVVDDLLPKHPLIYDSHNLCELASKGKFTTFAGSVLTEMCSSFGIDVEDIHVKRRKPYADRLQSLCDACT